ncbi:BgTH12-03653 [Blumeria graminis f. sp. triticale]|uniref:BgTH12-03653 n=1 Tax=Blumeria graminis f. sp. triticale TaxID=1689686 RepID=A0A9W4CW92_BLUGR|nr:BgTH12-03653 [Blumeria graminis f. sp. triticale]
MRSTNSMTDG